MGVGFIRDKLEIKFLILYIAARVSEPLPLEGMQELTMCDDGIDFNVAVGQGSRFIKNYRRDFADVFKHFGIFDQNSFTRPASYSDHNCRRRCKP